MNISDTGSPTTCHKVSSGSHSSGSCIKAILLRAPLVSFLLTGLSPRLPDGDRFCDMTNDILEPLAMLEIHRYIIRERFTFDLRY